MSTGTVPVVTAVGAHPDVIQPGVSGFLVDPDAAGLSAGIADALALSPDALASIGAAARAATTRFSWAGIAPQYEGIYESVIASSKGHRATAKSA